MTFYMSLVLLLLGQRSVKSSVVKDGNVFMIHVTDPIKPDCQSKQSESSSHEVEKADVEQSEKATAG